MAFIRKHRVMLAPLLVVAIVGAGLFLVLRSESEEPIGARRSGNVAATAPEETVQAWQEDVAKRTQHGREYQVTRTLEYVDSDTGETVTDQTVSTVRAVGTNLCYRDARGRWQPTVPEWRSTGGGFVMDKNSWRIEVPLTLGAAYEYVVGGQALHMRPAMLVLSDGQRTVMLGRIDPNAAGRVDPQNASKLVFADALGPGSGVDVELIVERASLHQNVVLRHKPVLPSRFNEETARLYVYTELGLDAFARKPGHGVRLGRNPLNVSSRDLATARNQRDPIAFTRQERVNGELRDRVLHRFVESKVWDETGAQNETYADRQLWRHPVTQKPYLVESIPYSYIADATGAVTLDYDSQNGDIDYDQMWTADATYYVEDNVNVSHDENPVTLTIEPGTVIKFASGKSINIGANGAIVAKGEPFRYIVFTSDQDDESGEDLTWHWEWDEEKQKDVQVDDETSGSPADYHEAINIGSVASTDCRIEFCKFGYAEYGVKVLGDDIEDGIRHCIFRQCTGGVYLYCCTLSVFNCLIADTACGVNVNASVVSFTVNVQNCTFDNCSQYGLRLNGSGAYPALCGTISENLFTNNQIGIKREYDPPYYDVTIDYNAYYNNISNVTGSGMDEGDHPVYLGVSPYDGGTGYNDSPLGKYFVDTTDVGGGGTKDGSDLVDPDGLTITAAERYGDGSAFSIEAPEEVTAAEDHEDDIEEGDLPWENGDGDEDTVDIGYHHPRIDKLITSEIWCSTGDSLTIKPGTVVVTEGSSHLRLLNNGKLTCNGCPDEMVMMIAGIAASMAIESPLKTSSSPDSAFIVSDNHSGSTSVTYTYFRGQEYGFRTRTNSTQTVAHCVFEACYGGYKAIGADAEVTNCRFDCCNIGLYLTCKDEVTTCTVRNCTIDRCSTGLQLREYSGTTFIIKDCLISRCGWGMDFGVGNPSNWTGIDNNAFYGCGRKYVHEPCPGPIGPHSLNVLENPYDTGWTDWGDQWYLDQDGDCIDAGSGVVQNEDIDLDTFSTSRDGKVDVATVDIGYHYPGPADLWEWDEGNGIVTYGNVDIERGGITIPPFAADITSITFTASQSVVLSVSFPSDSTSWVIKIDGQAIPDDPDGTGDIIDKEVPLTGLAPHQSHTVCVDIEGTEDDIEFTIYIAPEPGETDVFITVGENADHNWVDFGQGAFNYIDHIDDLASKVKEWNINSLRISPYGFLNENVPWTTSSPKGIKGIGDVLTPCHEEGVCVWWVLDPIRMHEDTAYSWQGEGFEAALADEALKVRNELGWHPYWQYVNEPWNASFIEEQGTALTTAEAFGQILDYQLEMQGEMLFPCRELSGRNPKVS